MSDFAVEPERRPAHDARIRLSARGDNAQSKRQGSDEGANRVVRTGGGARTAVIGFSPTAAETVANANQFAKAINRFKRKD